jgi:S1-C subfamily serine protease
MQTRGELGKLATALEGIPVWGCLPGSVAQAAGIQYGDVVLAVNGKRTKDLDDYLAARQLRNDGAEVVVFRNGSEQTIDLIFRATTEPPDRLIGALVQQVVEGRLLPLEQQSTKPETGAVN